MKIVTSEGHQYEHKITGTDNETAKQSITIHDTAPVMLRCYVRPQPVDVCTRKLA